MHHKERYFMSLLKHEYKELLGLYAVQYQLRKQRVDPLTLK